MNKRVVIKNEGHEHGMIVGPVYIETNGQSVPYQKNGNFAKWFTYVEAEKIAKKLGLNLVEC